MVKHRIIYEIKKDNRIIEHIRDFKDLASACTFIREIKNFTCSKPILTEVKGNDYR